MNERQMLLKKIKEYDFSLKELNLYLDTHPNCRKALALFEKYKSLRNKSISDYTQRFGPLTPEQNSNSSHWDWIDDPWPWERR